MSPDPADVPIQLASTVILVDDRPDLQTLLLRRSTRSDFVGGMMVFPGGGLDAEDGEPGALGLCDDLAPETADRRLGVESGGLAYWVASIRESFEEAGVLLVRGRNGAAPPDLSDPASERRFDAHRSAVDGGERPFCEVIEAEDLALDVGNIFYVGRWITPVGPPRRYDTRFFVAALPEGQTPLHDNREAVHSEWARPAEALERFASGDYLMLPPTVAALEALAGFGSRDELLAVAAGQQDGPDRQAHIAHPPGSKGTKGMGGPTGGWKVLFPGDPGYEDAGPVEGWMRLAPHGP